MVTGLPGAHAPLPDVGHTDWSWAHTRQPPRDPDNTPEGDSPHLLALPPQTHQSGTAQENHTVRLFQATLFDPHLDHPNYRCLLQAFCNELVGFAAPVVSPVFLFTLLRTHSAMGPIINCFHSGHLFSLQGKKVEVCTDTLRVFKSDHK